MNCTVNDDTMKLLNKYCPKSGLNRKLRVLYKIKQDINNSPLDGDMKKDMMNKCDRLINECWRRQYQDRIGYDI